MATLASINELIKKNDDIIIDNQDEANDTLESIDDNIKEFLNLQKRTRLDNLEDRREKKSKDRGKGFGLGKAAAVGLAAGAGAGLASDALGDAAGNIIKQLAIAGTVVGGGILALNKAIKAAKKIPDLFDNLEKRITALDEKLKQRRIALEIEEKKLAEDRKKLKKEEKKIKRLPPDFETSEAELKNKQKRIAEFEAKKASAAKLADDIETNKKKIAARQAEIDAVNEETKKRKRRTMVRDMETADRKLTAKQNIAAAEVEAKRVAEVEAKRVAEADAKKAATDKMKAADVEGERLKQSRISEKQRLREAADMQKNQDRLKMKAAEADAAYQANEDRLKKQRAKENLAAQMELERKNRLAQVSFNEPEGPKTIKPTKGTVTGRFTRIEDYMDPDFFDPRTPQAELNNRLKAQKLNKTKSKVGGKVIKGGFKTATSLARMFPVVAAADAAIVTAMGGGAQVEEDLKEGDKSKRAEVASRVAGEFIGFFGDVISFVDNGTNSLINKAFGTDLKTDRDLGGVLREGVTGGLNSAAQSLNIGQGEIGGTTAGTLVNSKDFLGLNSVRQIEGQIAELQMNKLPMQDQLNAGMSFAAATAYHPDDYESEEARLVAINEKIAELEKQLALKLEKNKNLQDLYKPVGTNMEAVNETNTSIEAEAELKNRGVNSVVAPSVTTNSDSSTKIEQTNVNAASGITIDPKARSIPGYGSGPF